MTMPFSTFLPSGPAAPADTHMHPDLQTWQRFLRQHPVRSLLRPDFYLIFKYTDCCQILYQENIGLDLGDGPVSYETLTRVIRTADCQFIRKVDQAVIQLIRERKLQPFDFVYRIGSNVEAPNPAFRRVMRTCLLIDTKPGSILGMMCFHDITHTVTTVRPNSFDLSCRSGLEFLAGELQDRVCRSDTEQQTISPREQDILQCLRRGLNSKQIADELFIAKSTVDTHRQNMLRKWGLPNTAALLQRAHEEGWG